MQTSTLALLLFTTAATGCGVVGGIFFAFSNFIMRALGELPPAQGVAAMQAINRTVLNPLFFLVFFGSGLAALIAAGHAWLTGGTASALIGTAAAVSHVAGSLGVTLFGNVPLNNRLAGLGAHDAALAATWTHYQSAWTRLNTVRTAASVLAAALFCVAAAL